MITTTCYKELFKYDITAGAGRRGVYKKCEEGGGGVENPPKKCDIIFEQP